MKKALLVSVWCSFFPLSGHAGLDTELRIGYSQSDLCSSVSTRIFFRSKHALGDRGGRLNERNGGVSGDCYHGKDRNFYTIVGGLENSQWGQTLVFGPGYRLRSPQFLGLSVGAGFEMPFIYYETPYSRKRQYAYGFLPIIFRTITLELPRMNGKSLGYMTLEERQLGGFGSYERVKLYALGWQKEW